MAMNPADLPHVRRVVTGHDDNGKAVVMTDGPATQTKSPGEGARVTTVWSTNTTPIDDLSGKVDRANLNIGTPPPENGTRLSVLEIAPGAPGGMHRTETLDYAIVLAGEIDMVMDGDTVHLKAGDIVVQKGTVHSWVNRGSDIARVAVVLIDAEPLGIGNPIVRGNTPVHNEHQ